LRVSFLVVFLFMTILIVYDYVIFPNVGEWNDTDKIIVACMLNPLVWELPLTIVRTVARVMPYNHPTTNYVFPSLIIAGKKATGRFVIATMKSEWAVRAQHGSMLHSACSHATDGDVGRTVGRCIGADSVHYPHMPRGARHDDRGLARSGGLQHVLQRHC
jgi:hypothetical protein